MTGASRGIGKAVALRLAQDGFPVLLNYRSQTAAAEEVKRQIEDAGGKAELLPFDVSDPKAIEASLEQWAESHGEQCRHPFRQPDGVHEW